MDVVSLKRKNNKNNKNNMKVTKQKASKAGFSLVEMLVVIAVIGIIAGLAVPKISRINDSAKDARKRRNAQNVASIFASAQAAGYDFSKADGNGADLADEAAIVGAVITGATITEAGPFNGTFFGVPGMNSTQAVSESEGASQYLTWDGTSGLLLYTGGQAAEAEEEEE